jgi:hypothetical protein
VIGGSAESGRLATYFPGNGIPSHGGYAAIPQPLQELDRRFDARVLRRFLRSVGFLLLGCEGLPFWDQTCADEEDVAFARGYVCGFTHGLDGSEGYRMG